MNFVFKFWLPGKFNRTGVRTQIKDEEGSRHQPVQIADIEKLSASCNCSPALAREHREVCEGRYCANESVCEVVLPPL